MGPSFGLIVRASPSRSKPYKSTMRGIFLANRLRIPHFILSDFVTDSDSANDASRESCMSLSLLKVSILSVSKNTPTGVGRFLRLRTVAIVSTTFRPKRETDFVMILVILPALQSSSIRIKSFLRLMLVAEIPSSANVKQGLKKFCKQIVNNVEKKKQTPNIAGFAQSRGYSTSVSKQ